ncbi:hypothetical protein QVD17_16154 [Tagetes erecta]|uniref:Uncharacterized protein n=1 Tax=Tagetes erecta TaxID=13708 RepID=A0AAD8KR72_TARER|nr:hypothetical protein QVD17_16154 [Tagetes erecta]
MDEAPSISSVLAMIIHDQLSDNSYSNEQAPSIGSVAMPQIQVSDQLTDTSYDNKQPPSMTMVDNRGHSQSAGESFSYNDNAPPPSLSDVARRHTSYTGPDAMEMDNNFPKHHTAQVYKHRIFLCKVDGCTKEAMGGTRRCICHGGEQRRQRLRYKAHGGGRHCRHLWCTKSVEGRAKFCRAHRSGRLCGGGKRCKMELGSMFS